MGSVGNQGNLPLYDSYKDCSLGICSIYCPQWCYMIFPPPPPRDDDSSGTNFPPLIITVIGILVSAFLMVSYYTIISKYCKRRNQNQNQNQNQTSEVNSNQLTHDTWQLDTGLEESVIKSMAVFKFVKGNGLIDGSDCAVCLSEFQENENLRLLHKCSHAFHVACIDTWLRSHSNCPLCRSNVAIPNSQTSSNLNVSSFELQRQNDTILVLEERERGYREEEVVDSFVSDLTSIPKNLIQDHNDLECENGEMGDQERRRSDFLGSFSCQRDNNLLISDILKIEDDYDEDELQGAGSSNGDRISLTGRFMFMKNNDKGKKSILPN